jgi:hypothetical protein
MSYITEVYSILLTWQARTQKVRAFRGMNNINMMKAFMLLGDLDATSTEKLSDARVAYKERIAFATAAIDNPTVSPAEGLRQVLEAFNVEAEFGRKIDTYKDTIEINGIEYHIDGEHLNFMCDYVDAEVHRYEDGSWEIINIIGKHKKDE